MLKLAVSEQFIARSVRMEDAACVANLLNICAIERTGQPWGEPPVSFV